MKKLKILVPLDYSALSTKALIQALKLNKYLNAELILFHSVFISGTPEFFIRKLKKTLQEEAEIELHNVMNTAMKLTGIKVKYKIASTVGNPQVEIKKYAEKIKADIIIMGSQGASGLKKLLIGSVAAEVAENAPCVVIIIPAEVGIPKQVKKIIYATDLASLNIEAGIAVAFAKVFNATLNLVHVYPENFEIDPLYPEAQAQKLRKKYKYDLIDFNAVMDKNLKSGLVNYMKRNKPDMLMFFNHSDEGAARYFNDSFSKKYPYITKVPLVIIPRVVFKRNGAELINSRLGNNLH